MEHKNLQKAIGLYVISEMHKENILSVNEFRKLRRNFKK